MAFGDEGSEDNNLEWRKAGAKAGADAMLLKQEILVRFSPGHTYKYICPCQMESAQHGVRVYYKHCRGTQQPLVFRRVRTLGVAVKARLQPKNAVKDLLLK